MWKIVSNRDLKSLQESIDLLEQDVKKLILINKILKRDNTILVRENQERQELLDQMAFHIITVEGELKSGIKRLPNGMWAI